VVWRQLKSLCQAAVVWLGERSWTAAVAGGWFLPFSGSNPAKWSISQQRQMVEGGQAR